MLHLHAMRLGPSPNSTALQILPLRRRLVKRIFLGGGQSGHMVWGINKQAAARKRISVRKDDTSPSFRTSTSFLESA